MLQQVGQTWASKLRLSCKLHKMIILPRIVVISWREWCDTHIEGKRYLPKLDPKDTIYGPE